MATLTMCLPLWANFSAAPRRARLLLSVAPLVKTISLPRAPIAAATVSRAASTASFACRPKSWLRCRGCQSLAEVRQHGLQHARIDRRGGVVVEVNGMVDHASLPKIAFMQICDQVSKPLMSARISSTGRNPQSMIFTLPGMDRGSLDVEDVDNAEVDLPDLGLIVVDQADAAGGVRGVDGHFLFNLAAHAFLVRVSAADGRVHGGDVPADAHAPLAMQAALALPRPAGVLKDRLPSAAVAMAKDHVGNQLLVTRVLLDFGAGTKAEPVRHNSSPKIPIDIAAETLKIADCAKQVRRRHQHPLAMKLVHPTPLRLYRINIVGCHAHACVGMLIFREGGTWPRKRGHGTQGQLLIPQRKPLTGSTSRPHSCRNDTAGEWPHRRRGGSTRRRRRSARAPGASSAASGNWSAGRRRRGIATAGG